MRKEQEEANEEEVLEASLEEGNLKEANEDVVDNDSNNVVPSNNNLPITNLQHNIDTEIKEVTNRLYNNSGENVDGDLQRLNYLQKIKSSLRMATIGEKYDDILQVVVDRFENDYPSFSNRELLDYAVQLQGIMDNTRRATNDDILSMPSLIQNNTQINIDPNALDRASRERVVNVVKSILGEAKKGDTD